MLVLVMALLSCTPEPGGAPAGDTGSPGDDTGAPGDDTGSAPDDTGPPCAPPEGTFEPDARGGDARVALEATGWFRTEQLCERWWLVTPDGHPFYSTGINVVGPAGSTGQETGRNVYAETVAALYESEEAWADVAQERMAAWGVSTAGGWSDTELMAPRVPVMPVIYLAGGDWQTGEVSDWWSGDWEASVDEALASVVAPWAEDPHVLGWFLDNEIRWGPDWRSFDTLLQSYLAFGPDSAGKAVAVDLLLAETGSVEAANALLGTDLADRDAMLAATDAWEALDPGESATADALTTAFLELAAERYYSFATAALREAAPHQLVAGNRDVGVLTRIEPHLAAARYCDVLSINDYTFVDGVAEAAIALSGAVDPADGFAALHEVLVAEDLDRPLLVTEFSFRAGDSGMPNTWPPIYPTFDTQEERAAAFADYARLEQSTPWIVGYHWYRWMDDPVDGRFDGEDSNFGVVTEATRSTRRSPG